MKYREYFDKLVFGAINEFSSRQLAPPSNTVTLLKVEGSSLHIESEEGKKQTEEFGTGKIKFIIERRNFISVPYLCLEWCLRNWL